MNEALKQKIEKILACEQIGQFSCVTVTEKKALKKNRVTKEPTPEHISVLTKVASFSCFIGNDYESLVNLKREREDKDANFESSGSYIIPYKNSKILFVHKDDPEKFYIRVYANVCGQYSGSSAYYDKNNTKVDFSKLQAEYFDLPSAGNTKQDLDNEVLVFNFKLENVKYLKRGDEIIICEGEDLPKLF